MCLRLIRRYVGVESCNSNFNAMGGFNKKILHSTWVAIFFLYNSKSLRATPKQYHLCNCLRETNSMASVLEPTQDEHGENADHFQDSSCHAIQLIRVEGEKFRFTDEGRAFLSSLKAPLCVVSVVGQQKSGKSFFLNKVLLNLRTKGFAVASSTASCTEGIWVWG